MYFHSMNIPPLYITLHSKATEFNCVSFIIKLMMKVKDVTYIKAQLCKVSHISFLCKNLSMAMQNSTEKQALMKKI